MASKAVMAEAERLIHVRGGSVGDDWAAATARRLGIRPRTIKKLVHKLYPPENGGAKMVIIERKTDFQDGMPEAVTNELSIEEWKP